MNDDNAFYAHIIDVAAERMLAKRRLAAVPLVGHQLRLQGAHYFEVIQVVWCLDEQSPGGRQRINIGVKEVA
jgi:hypothetical protein